LFLISSRQVAIVESCQNLFLFFSLCIMCQHLHFGMSCLPQMDITALFAHVIKNFNWKPISCGTASIKIKIIRMQASLVYSMCSYFHLCCSAKAKNLKGWDNARQIENHFGVLLRRAGQDTRECQVSLAILAASSVCCSSGGNWWNLPSLKSHFTA